ncbi:hypothetical protein LguiB_000012 [Lonicera macranthoides]
MIGELGGSQYHCLGNDMWRLLAWRGGSRFFGLPVASFYALDHNFSPLICDISYHKLATSLTPVFNHNKRYSRRTPRLRTTDPEGSKAFVHVSSKCGMAQGLGSTKYGSVDGYVPQVIDMEISIQKAD